jgi:hypothetical protein
LKQYKALHFVLFASAISLISWMPPQAAAQDGWHEPDPCAVNFGPSQALKNEGKKLPVDRMERPGSMISLETTNGLESEEWGLLVYDANQGLCWLADANLAGSSEVRALMGVGGINPDGTMTYAVALNWVNALNSFDGGRGLLGHNNWQLPVTAQYDNTNCSSSNNGSFGVLCSGSALGNLYSVGLNLTFPSSVVPHFAGAVWPFRDLQPGLYWTSDSDAGGEVTFSFNTGLNGANTTKYNYFHVLPMTKDLLGTPPTGTGVFPYTSGPAAGKAVYDSLTGKSWTLDANLAAQETFGVSGKSMMGPTVSNTYLTGPRIDEDGSMLFDTIGAADGWLTAMNSAEYAGSANWQVPSLMEIANLYDDMSISSGDTRLEAYGRLGPFWNFQPSFYWSCERDQAGDSQSLCDPALYPSENEDGTIFEYSFDFDNGFEGTDFDTKQFYVTVYYPVPGH